MSRKDSLLYRRMGKLPTYRQWYIYRFTGHFIKNDQDKYCYIAPYWMFNINLIFQGHSYYVKPFWKYCLTYPIYKLREKFPTNNYGAGKMIGDGRIVWGGEHISDE